MKTSKCLLFWAFLISWGYQLLYLFYSITETGSLMLSHYSSYEKIMFVIVPFAIYELASD